MAAEITVAREGGGNSSNAQNAVRKPTSPRIQTRDVYSTVRRDESGRIDDRDWALAVKGVMRDFPKQTVNGQKSSQSWRLGGGNSLQIDKVYTERNEPRYRAGVVNRRGQVVEQNINFTSANGLVSAVKQLVRKHSRY